LKNPTCQLKNKQPAGQLKNIKEFKLKALKNPTNSQKQTEKPKYNFFKSQLKNLKESQKPTEKPAKVKEKAN